MRRYIIVALAALVIFTGCKLSDGTTPDPNGSEKLIWSRAYTTIHSSSFYSNLAIYGEALLNEDAPTAEAAMAILAMSDYSVEVEAEQIVLSKNLSTYQTRTYTIVTKGRKLSEGGVWQLSLENNYNSSIQKHQLALYTGKEGAVNTFTCRVTLPYDYSYEGYATEIDSDISYVYLAEAKAISATVNFSGHIVSDNYTIDFVAQPQMPFVFANDLLMTGAVDIVYKDTERGASKQFTTTVVKAFETTYDIYNTVIYRQ